MKKLVVRSTLIAICCAVFNIGTIGISSAQAFGFRAFYDRAPGSVDARSEWENAARIEAIRRGIINQADPLLPNVIERFDSPISNARNITFPSGIVSVGRGQGVFANQVADGTYEGFLSAPITSSSPSGLAIGELFFDTVQWSFPVPVIAFGGNFDTKGKWLGLEFGSPGDRFALGPSTPRLAFFGIVLAGDDTTAGVRFSSVFNLDETIVNFEVDNFSTYAVPEPTTMVGIALAGSGLALLRRKKQVIAQKQK